MSEGVERVIGVVGPESNDNSFPLRVTKSGEGLFSFEQRMGADNSSTTCRDQCLLSVYQQATPKNA